MAHDLRISHGMVPHVHAGVRGFRVGHLLIRDGRIAEVTDTTRAESARVTLDAGGCCVLPGFVDIHVHGGAGYDTMDATDTALAGMARFAVTHGVTSFLATTMTAPAEHILQAVTAVRSAPRRPAGGARLLGVHLEGPFISPLHPGAQAREHVRPPDLAEFRALLAAGPVRMLTLAPEVPGAQEVMAEALARGITLVLGHTDATYQQAEEAFSQGARQATHTYNAMTGLHHRRPGAVGAVLSNDTVYAQLIADNVHVHAAAIKILARCKGVERTILITDAIRAAGLAPGDYDLGGQGVTMQNGACRLADGTLAGSILTMERALANFMQAAGLSLAEAWPATSLTPLTSVGLDQDLGRVQAGRLADLVLLDAAGAVVATLVAGEIVYLPEAGRMHRA